MDQHDFQIADRHVEKIAERLDQILQSPELQPLREALIALGKDLGDRYLITLSCLVEVTDQKEERTLPLLNTGLCTSNGAEPYRVHGDSTPQRYVVDGQIQVVPHDHCPKCWGPWDFKLQNRRCSSCDAELGKNVKLLLDSDVCPHCEEGKVTAKKPRCSKCDFVVDQSLVAWG